MTEKQNQKEPESLSDAIKLINEVMQEIDNRKLGFSMYSKLDSVKDKIKNFIRKEGILLTKLFNKLITWDEFIEGRHTLVGKGLI